MKKIHMLFVCAVMAILTAALCRTLFFPKEINQYENRYASQMPPFSVSGFLDGSYQDAVDSALMDQIPLAQRMKSAYNQNKIRFLRFGTDALLRRGALSPLHYIEFNGLRLFGDGYITYWPRTVDSVQEALDAKLASLNNTFARHPEVDFYLYYIEKDTDVDFETLKKTGLFPYLQGGLALPTDHVGLFSMSDFQTFSQEFYKTDAHWNHNGSLRGYREVLNLLEPTASPLSPIGEPVLVSHDFSGKKAASVAGEGVFTEDFYAYPYDFPAISVQIDGQPAEDYGAQTAFLSGTATEAISYGGFYGGDNGETVFSTGTEGRGNLLVVGESFDNAILKLLSTHYDHVFSVDLRYYAHSMGTPFDFSAYVKNHAISKVLLIGNIDYFIQDTFDLEG